MRILIEISIKIYFMDIAAGNGPKVQSARAPATNRSHAHDTSMQRTIVKAHTWRSRPHTRRQRARTLVTTRTRRTRDVDAQARSWQHEHGAHAHETLMQRTFVKAHTWRSRTHTRRRHARTPVRTRLRHARMHTRRTCKARSWTHAHDGHARMRACTHAFVRVVVKGERCRYSMTATLECVSMAHQATLYDWRMWYSHICLLT